MERFICIHGHFYQPPRENPWLESVELQDSAYPFHDWNERITAECYGPNATSRILDGEGRIARIVNNYARISFNIGPTLLGWMEEKTPDVYQGILEADIESQERFSGHGSAIAQAYNHMILPLANRRDKETQIIWGLADFEHRFKRKPEGMWLAETAVDRESLAIMAEHGIKYTILSPYQAGRIREIGAQQWQEHGPGGVDPRRAYRVPLAGGKSIAVFFYDGPISRAVAFENLLSSGETFAQRLRGGFSDDRDSSQLVHIATDGETYGHHHPHGDMALAYALEYIESSGIASITNYGEYLERFPPTYEAEVIDNTSWSCAHGVERWRNNCGCNTGGRAGWTQEWRAPLREALDWLRDTLAPLFEEHGRTCLRDPWAAREDYVEVMLDRSPECVRSFLERHAARTLTETEIIRVLKLMELQRHAMLMFTSCGWFFDEISGIEPVQIIQYAGRAIQLADEVFTDASEGRFAELLEPPFLTTTTPKTGSNLEALFVSLLERARSNIPEMGNGRQIYERFVRPARVDLEQVAAHYAIRSLFEQYPEHAAVYGFDSELVDFQRREAGRVSLGVGSARITSRITLESELFAFGALHMGDHNLSAGVVEFANDEAYQNILEEVGEPFERADLPEVIRVLDRHFGETSYSLRSLFRDEQRQVLDRILDTTLAETETEYHRIAEHNEPLIRFLVGLGAPIPAQLRAAVELIVNTDLRRCLASDPLDREAVEALTTRAREWQLSLDTVSLSFVMKRALDSLASAFAEQPDDRELLGQLNSLVTLGEQLPFEVDVWKAQNAYYRVLQQTAPAVYQEAANGDALAQEWAMTFSELGDRLRVRRD
jgi:alpha-amylase/alpha-mannosidase (GH57 family)